MRFLADEDFPKPLVVKIRKLGHSIKTIQQENLQGSSDETVSKIALKERRILMIFDRDFLQNKTKGLQIIVFQFQKTPTKEIIPLTEKLFQELKKINLNKKKILKFTKFTLEPI